MTELKQEVTREIQRRANSIARKEGCGWATTITFDPAQPEGVVEHTSFGYRKKTTGEYVPNAYLRNFGWKNTYYQRAETVVNLHPE